MGMHQVPKACGFWSWRCPQLDDENHKYEP